MTATDDGGMPPSLFMQAFPTSFNILSCGQVFFTVYSDSSGYLGGGQTSLGDRGALGQIEPSVRD